VRRFVLRDGTVTVGRSFLHIFLWPRNSVSRAPRGLRDRQAPKGEPGQVAVASPRSDLFYGSRAI